MKRWIHATTDDFSKFYSQLDQLIYDHFDNRNEGSLLEDVMDHVNWMIEDGLFEDAEIDVPSDWKARVKKYIAEYKD